MLHIRVNPEDASSVVAFTLPLVDGETVAALKVRISERAGPHPSYFVVRVGERPLKLDEGVAALGESDRDITVDVAWNTCSHGAPAHPITGASACFWDGGEPSGPVEY